MTDRKPESGTPETDAQAWCETNQENALVTAKFARSLELRLTAARAEAEALRRDAARWQAFCNLWAASTLLEARQDEEGTWSIRQREPVENEVFAPLIGATPDAAIDAALTASEKRDG